ncbi:MAG: hypothetical protein GY714_20925 [Desulfobacterales bacterium]|nr:hypothetical protein [Desulfobacterales bacterium]
MLFFPIAQQDLEDRHPDLEDDLWASYTAVDKGDSDNVTLTFVSGNEWTLEDTDAAFDAGAAGLYGVLSGFWGFKIKTRDSATVLTVIKTGYPVSIVQADVTASLLGKYSIGGYARQIISAGEEIVKDFTNMKLYPEAFDWSERNRFQLESLFVYKTLSIIFQDMIASPEDRWDRMFQYYDMKYKNELNTIRISYQAENAEDDNDNFIIPEVLVRR